MKIPRSVLPDMMASAFASGSGSETAPTKPTAEIMLPNACITADVSVIFASVRVWSTQSRLERHRKSGISPNLDHMVHAGRDDLANLGGPVWCIRVVDEVKARRVLSSNFLRFGEPENSTKSVCVKAEKTSSSLGVRRGGDDAVRATAERKLHGKD